MTFVIDGAMAYYRLTGGAFEVAFKSGIVGVDSSSLYYTFRYRFQQLQSLWQNVARMPPQGERTEIRPGNWHDGLSLNSVLKPHS